MKSLPTNFVSDLQVMQNFRKAPIRVLPVATASDVKGSGTIKFLLPVGCVLDLKTFCMNFSGVTTLAGAAPAASATAGAARNVGFPKYMQSLIQTFEIWVNNRQVVCINEFGRVYALLQDFKGNRSRKLGNNADPSVYTYVAADGTTTGLATYRPTAAVGAAHDAANASKGDYCIDEWLGFLNPMNSSIVDTNLLGQIEIVLRLYSGNTVLWGSKDNANLDGTETLDFTLNNIVAYIDKIDFKENLYYDYMASLLKDPQGGMKIAYKNYTYTAGDATNGTKAITLKCTENAQCVDKLIFTFYDNTAAAIAGRQPLQLSADDSFASLVTKPDSTLLLNSSIYYNRNGWGVGTVEFEINSQPITGPLSITQQWEETLKAFECNEADDLKNINPAIRDLSHYKKNFYVCALSTSHINDRDPLIHYMSGIDTQSTSLQLTVKTNADPNNAWTAASMAAIPVLITEYTSYLTITGQRQVLPVR
jgi:hypothetical protein